jgi:hypothetical protein
LPFIFDSLGVGWLATLLRADAVAQANHHPHVRSAEAFGLTEGEWAEALSLICEWAAQDAACFGYAPAPECAAVA